MKKLNEFQNDLEGSLSSSENSQIELIKEKLNIICLEQENLLFKSINFSTKIMIKIMSEIESNKMEEYLISKIKLFLKITRLIAKNSKEAELEAKGKKEKEFFLK